LRDRGQRQPALDPVLAVLEAVQHPGLAVEHLRRPAQRDLPDHLLAGGLRRGERDDTGRRLRLVPADEPRDHLGAAGLLPRLARLGHLPGARRAQAGRDGGALHDRRRLGEGDRRPLRTRTSADQIARWPRWPRWPRWGPLGPRFSALATYAGAIIGRAGGNLGGAGPAGPGWRGARRPGAEPVRPGGARTPGAPPGRAGR